VSPFARGLACFRFSARCGRDNSDDRTEGGLGVGKDDGVDWLVQVRLGTVVHSLFRHTGNAKYRAVPEAQSQGWLDDAPSVTGSAPFE
jgi:hypothetical protein